MYVHAGKRRVKMWVHQKKKRRGSINEYDEIGQQGVAAALETQPEPDDRKFNFI